MVFDLLIFLAAVAVIFAALFLGGLTYYRLAPVFGGKPDNDSQGRITSSAHFDGRVFQNIQTTTVLTRNEYNLSYKAFLRFLFADTRHKNPHTPLPAKKLTAQALKDREVAWLGHSTVLFATAGMTVVSDPVFYRASPIALGGKPFKQSPQLTSRSLPALDVVLISHDHYDHLNMKSIREIDARVGKYLVPLGVKAHLCRWGVQERKIIEHDWYESTVVQDVEFIFAPSRHFSGRRLNDRFTTLWGSWIVKSPTLSLYFSGDGGYSSEFAKIGSRYGPFDIALMENGSYNPDWAQVHMFPEQTIQAAQDLRAQKVMPVHWAKFDLSKHHWLEPITRIMHAAEQQGVPLVTPYIGEVFSLDNPPRRLWWLAMEGENTLAGTSEEIAT